MENNAFIVSDLNSEVVAEQMRWTACVIASRRYIYKTDLIKNQTCGMSVPLGGGAASLSVSGGVPLWQEQLCSTDAKLQRGPRGRVSVARLD